MSISWATDKNSQSQVRYGLKPQDLSLSSAGTSTTYEFKHPLYAQYSSPYLHSVYLTDLAPSTTYFYQVGDFDIGDTSGILSFETLNAIGSTEPMLFAVIGDLGQTGDSISTLEHVLENGNLKAILHVGDLSYADCDQKQWDSYADMVQIVGSQRPWMVGAGNHEIEQVPDGNAPFFLAFEQRYKMPAVKPVDLGPVLYRDGAVDNHGLPYCTPSVFLMEYNYGNSFYSFEFGMVHVINLNPYSNCNSTSAQYLWLVEDLSKVDRRITPWIIVMMHGPWYNSNAAHQNEYQTVLMKSSMEALFYKYRVNVVFAGHVHAYERTYPVYNNKLTEDGITYIVIGDAGNAEGHASLYIEPVATWSAYRNGTQYGHGEIMVMNNTYMEWVWHRNVDGKVVEMDSVRICNLWITGKASC